MIEGELWIEKRRDERLDLSFPIVYSVIEGKKEARELNGTASNISQGGIKLVTQEPSEVGTLLDIKIMMPDNLPELCGKAKVIWKKGLPDKRSKKTEYHLGLKFTDFSSDNRDMISRFMVDNIKKASGLE